MQKMAHPDQEGGLYQVHEKAVLCPDVACQMLLSQSQTEELSPMNGEKT